MIGSDSGTGSQPTGGDAGGEMRKTRFGWGGCKNVLSVLFPVETLQGRKLYCNYYSLKLSKQMN